MNKNWLGLTTESTEHELINRLGVAQHMATGMANKIGGLDARLRDDFLKFWRKERFNENIEIEGWSYRTLMDHFGYNPIGGWMTLDWLCRESTEAKSALKYGIR